MCLLCRVFWEQDLGGNVLQTDLEVYPTYRVLGIKVLRGSKRFHAWAKGHRLTDCFLRGLAMLQVLGLLI